ncbi:hypothetical protein YPPY34_1835 [Yersinia pestis PY-34]|nr:hypothetical protein YpAngola_A3081 [Yersinia pestis Angola]ADV99146.1 hypothetical protein YPC_2593 [Yersinia pestis biovar Medievalis str. Harbin 35]EEO75988.1 hypothetical protein YP516_2733 [Yersinia pestis Nepal516]EEO81321.1 hypothetical protein YPF_2039 [Yersinia pestis biovar Orientalis str. India 195]EEO87952.1 hypothetical protein YPH_3925 [Yersinia pestis biovar Orientalis str. PEXU2]EEO90661.1 hypothetical protein YPS_2019 [Yersinia pestis Pestoides A]EIR05300.1 hypothetical pr
MNQRQGFSELDAVIGTRLIRADGNSCIMRHDSASPYLQPDSQMSRSG